MTSSSLGAKRELVSSGPGQEVGESGDADEEIEMHVAEDEFVRQVFVVPVHHVVCDGRHVSTILTCKIFLTVTLRSGKTRNEV